MVVKDVTGQCGMTIHKHGGLFVLSCVPEDCASSLMEKGRVSICESFIAVKLSFLKL